MMLEIYEFGVCVAGVVFGSLWLMLLVYVLGCHAIKFVTDAKEAKIAKFLRIVLYSKKKSVAGGAIILLFIMVVIATLLWPIALPCLLIYGALYLIRAMFRASKWIKVLAKISHLHPKGVKTKPGVDEEKVDLWKGELEIENSKEEK